MPFSPTRHFVILVLPIVFLMTEGINLFLNNNRFFKKIAVLSLLILMIYHLSFTIKFRRPQRKT